jgi:hypothetical protein
LVTSPVGWQEALPEILDAGIAVRRSSPFDEKARKVNVDTQILKARQFPLWLPVVAVVALLVPSGWVVAVPLFMGWGVLIAQAHKRGVALEVRLVEETNLLRAKALRENERHGALLTAANDGDLASLNGLLQLWLSSRPPTIATFEGGLAKSFGNRIDVWGRAIGRSEIVQVVPRIGRGRKTFYDKRKAAEIDEDLSEINAAALLSLIGALFSGPTLQSISVRIELRLNGSTAPVQWIVLVADLNFRSFEAISPVSSAVDAIRRLGGDVGHCRAQRYTAAGDAISHSGTLLRPESQPLSGEGLNSTFYAEGVVDGSASARHASYLTGPASLEFSSPSTREQSGGAKIPPAPPRFSSKATFATPLLVNVRGQFARVARKFAEYQGIPGAPLVPFQAYWATYANMSDKQLEFYFSWRGAVRGGYTPPTNLSYIFVHVCELLHLIGAVDAADATRQLQNLWTAYRAEFPKLDLYLIPWTADLYALEIDVASAVMFMSDAASKGADLGKEELLLVTDQYWSKGDYSAMPAMSVANLVGDSRLGSNKFYMEYNADGWLDRAYREALAVTDSAYLATNGKSVRDAALLRDGSQILSREAFRGAVYDWKKRQVKFGKAPSLDEQSLAVQLYRNAARYSENLLRKEKNFPSKLRGITIPSDIESALTTRFADFVRITRPKARVNIDFAKAAELSKSSEDVRARLLAGLDESGEVAHAVSAVDSANSQSASTDISGQIGLTGLLTDLDAVIAVLGSLSEAARTLIHAVEKHGWEVEISSPDLEADCNGALLQPLIEEINARSQATLRQPLIVRENELLVLQEDLRDEVYWVIKGSLEGFARSVVQGSSQLINGSNSSVAGEIAESGDFGIGNTDGFDAAELQALHVLNGEINVVVELSELATSIGQTPLLLLDRINEVALDGPCGDLIVDCEAVIPAILPDAREYVEELLMRTEVALHATQHQQ